MGFVVKLDLEGDVVFEFFIENRVVQILHKFHMVQISDSLGDCLQEDFVLFDEHVAAGVASLEVKQIQHFYGVLHDLLVLLELKHVPKETNTRRRFVDGEDGPQVVAEHVVSVYYPQVVLVQVQEVALENHINVLVKLVALCYALRDLDLVFSKYFLFSVIKSKKHL